MRQVRCGDRNNQRPFFFGAPVPPDRFYGRCAQRTELRDCIESVSAPCLSVVGLQHSGKSSLLHYVIRRQDEFFSPGQSPVLVYLDLQNPIYHAPANLNEGIRRGLEKATGSTPWQRNENNNPSVVERGLAALRDRGHRLIVLIDEFGQIERYLDRFQGWAHDWRSRTSAGFFALIIASARPVHEIYTHLGLSSPFGTIFTEITLGALATEEWHTLVREGFAQDESALDAADLEVLDHLSGGMPFFVQMAAALLWRHRDHRLVREQFAYQSRPTFMQLWDSLRSEEQVVVRQAAVKPECLAQGSESANNDLLRYGVLRPDGCLFSTAFAAFVRDRQ